MNSDCPFTSGKKIKETHYLFCVPGDFDGKPLTINLLEELYRNDDKKISFDKMGRIDYTQYDFFQNRTAEFKWFLMFEGTVPSLKNEGLKRQSRVLSVHGYELPTTIEVALMLLLIHEKNGYLVGEEMAESDRTFDILNSVKSVVIETGKNGVSIYCTSSTTKSPDISVYASKKL